MRKLCLALIAALLASPAYADFTAKDAALATITFKNPSGTCTSVVCVPVAAIVDSTGTNVVAVPTAGADAVSNTANGLLAYGRNLVFNGTTWDRWTGAISGTVTANIGTVGTLSTAANQTSQITQETASATAAGTPADAAWVSGSGSLIAIAKTISANTGAAIPAGTATIGNVGSDPSSGKGTPSSVAINVSTATTTQLVAISGSTKIYVTSFDVVAGGTGNITFVYGTGSSCGTGTTSLTGAYNLTAQSGIAKGSGVAAVLVTPAGQALCVTTSAAVQMSGSISYQQF